MKNLKKYSSWVALAFVLLQAGLLVLLDLFYIVNVNYDLHRVVLAFMFLVCGGTAFFYGFLCEWKIKKNLLFTAISVLCCPGIGIILSMYLIRDVFGVDQTVTYAVSLAFGSVYALVYFILQLKKGRDKNRVRKIIACVLCAVILLAQCILPILDGLKFNYKVPTLTGLSTYTAKAYPLVDGADVYVATDGDDETGDGSFGSPYKTIERAKEVVRGMERKSGGITVAIKTGEYRTANGLVFTEEDSGTDDCPITYCAYGDGEVIINGGVTLSPTDFTPVKDDGMKNRLNKNVRDKVLQLDLSSYYITREQYGEIYVFGSHTSASKYDGYIKDAPVYSELFFNDRRMNLARYPDSGYLKTGKVVEIGRGLESDGSHTADPEYWEDARNPKGDTYKLSNKLAKRVSSWQTLDDVWMFGFFKYTWADSTTTIASFDARKKTLTTKYVSLYGAIEDAPYYFFNVFEELDAPGEWYLDRNTGIVYMYPTGDMESAVIDMSLSTAPVIGGETSNVTFKNVTVKGTRGNGIELTGDNNTVNLCTVKNIGANAILLTGSNNIASENEITGTGRGGIILEGGDTETLTPGGNVAYNNLIHDWSEIYLTYQAGVTLIGVGNVCSHNEMYNSPHEAVTYDGNNHLIEYNNIHNVCLLSDDAGAIYSGKRWFWYGNVIQFNAVYDLGSGDHHPCGIYMDDALSGQTIYGNILVNVPDIGLHLGGGRDLIVKNNIIINSNVRSITYDSRAREGALKNGWFDHSYPENGDMWIELFESPWQTDIWQEAFPQYKHFSCDFSDPDNPDFAPNPAYSEVTGNVCINLFKRLGDISDDAYRFSTIKDNPVYYLSAASSIFVDYKNGDYRLKEGCRVFDDLPEFQQIPISKIGRE